VCSKICPRLFDILIKFNNLFKLHNYEIRPSCRLGAKFVPLEEKNKITKNEHKALTIDELKSQTTGKIGN
jgi:hypothetical protein